METKTELTKKKKRQPPAKQLRKKATNKVESAVDAASKGGPKGPAIPTLKNLLHQTFLSSDEPSFIFDPYTGVLLHTNIAARHFFKQPANVLDGLTVDKLYPQSSGPLYVFTEETLEKGHARTRELVQLRPDGVQINIEHCSAALKHDGGTSIFVRLIDLDALHQRDLYNEAESYLKKGFHQWQHDEKYFREIEREYRLILAAAGEGIYGLDKNGLITFSNEASTQILGPRRL